MEIQENTEQKAGKSRLLLVIIFVLIALVGCGTKEASDSSPAPDQLADELIFYDWAGDMPQTILDAFTKEYGITITYLTYETQDEALNNITEGQIYDVVVLDNDIIPTFLANELLAEINYRNVPNFKNIAPDFRDLAYDSENKHAIPWNWGTTGLVIRSDLVDESIDSWKDLWDPRYAGRIALRREPHETVGIALKSLGYSVNSEDPAELKQAEEQLLELKEAVILVESYAEAAVPKLLSGEAVILVGWSEDVLIGREENEAITYILPREGALLWGDNFAIPANSPRKYTAEVFLNFLLRPEINAQIVNENHYASANEAARTFIDPKILSDPAIYPARKNIRNAEAYLSLSSNGKQIYNEIFERFAADIK